MNALQKVAAVMALVGIDVLSELAEFESRYVPKSHSLRGSCANQSREAGGTKCPNHNVPGHIYCTPCYVANGGYDRYNRPAKRH